MGQAGERRNTDMGIRRLRMRPVKIAKSPYSDDVPCRQWVVKLECGHELIVNGERQPRMQLYNCDECVAGYSGTSAQQFLRRRQSLLDCNSGARGTDGGQWLTAIPPSHKFKFEF